MDDIGKLARSAGILYALDALLASAGFLYDPGKLVDAASMANAAERIRTAQSMIRLDMLCEVSYQTVEVFLALLLYRLFKPTSAGLARQMLVLALIPIPVVFLNLTTEIGAMMIASDSSIATAFEPPQRDALAGLCVRLHGQGLEVAAIFWGLWLIPFGLLIIRCGFIPKIFGLFSIVGGLGYVLGSGASLIMPGLLPDALASGSAGLANFLELGELPVIVWLLIRGARPQEAS